MGKNGGKEGEGASNSLPGFQNSITLRQEKSGRIRLKSHQLNVRHLEKIAVWASGHPSLPSLAAFFGQRLAATAECLGLAPDPSHFLCQRCETVLLPGSNCSVRIEKTKAKRRRNRNKCNNLSQNNVVYYCHYCSCRNIQRGTPKGHMKKICLRRSEAMKQSKPMKFGSEQKDMKGKDENGKDSKECVTATVHTSREMGSPVTPPSKTDGIHTVDGTTITYAAETGTTLLTAKKKKKKKKKKRKRSAFENQSEPQSESLNNYASTDGENSVQTSKRRKRKSWKSLKEIAQTNEESGKLGNIDLAIPFSL